MATTKRKIPALNKIAEIARQYVKHDPELAAAFSDLDEAINCENERYKQALKTKGINCAVCNKRFLPLPDDFSNCCSIGCKLNY